MDQFEDNIEDQDQTQDSDSIEETEEQEPQDDGSLQETEILLSMIDAAQENRAADFKNTFDSMLRLKINDKIEGLKQDVSASLAGGSLGDEANFVDDSEEDSEDIQEELQLSDEELDDFLEGLSDEELESLQEELELDEGSSGLARQNRRLMSDFRKNGFKGGDNKLDRKYAHKRSSSEARAKKEADWRARSGLSAKVLIDPTVVKRLATDRSRANRIGQKEKSQENKAQGKSENRKPGSVNKYKYRDAKERRGDFSGLSKLKKESHESTEKKNLNEVKKVSSSRLPRGMTVRRTPDPSSSDQRRDFEREPVAHKGTWYPTNSNQPLGSKRTKSSMATSDAKFRKNAAKPRRRGPTQYNLFDKDINEGSSGLARQKRVGDARIRKAGDIDWGITAPMKDRKGRSEGQYNRIKDLHKKVTGKRRQKSKLNETNLGKMSRQALSVAKKAYVHGFMGRSNLERNPKFRHLQNKIKHAENSSEKRAEKRERGNPYSLAKMSASNRANPVLQAHVAKHARYNRRLSQAVAKIDRKAEGQPETRKQKSVSKWNYIPSSGRVDEAAKPKYTINGPKGEYVELTGSRRAAKNISKKYFKGKPSTIARTPSRPKLEEGSSSPARKERQERGIDKVNKGDPFAPTPLKNKKGGTGGTGKGRIYRHKLETSFGRWKSRTAKRDIPEAYNSKFPGWDRITSGISNYDKKQAEIDAKNVEGKKATAQKTYSKAVINYMKAQGKNPDGSPIKEACDTGCSPQLDWAREQLKKRRNKILKIKSSGPKANIKEMDDSTLQKYKQEAERLRKEKLAKVGKNIKKLAKRGYVMPSDDRYDREDEKDNH